MTSYLLTTERLGLRKWLDSDTQPFININKDPKVMKYFPKTLTEAETIALVKRINLHFDKNNFGLFAVEDKLTKQFLGFTGFAIPTFNAPFMPSVEIGWRYKSDVWGQGFATEAARACLKYGFDTLNFDKVISFTSSINKISEIVMQKLGMTFLTNFDHPNVEKDCILCSHVVYQITKEQFESPAK